MRYGTRVKRTRRRRKKKKEEDGPHVRTVMDFAAAFFLLCSLGYMWLRHRADANSLCPSAGGSSDLTK